MSRVYSWQGWRVVTAALLAVLLLASWLSQQASANHTPADKVVAAGSTVQRVPANEPGKTFLMGATMKTSKPTDLILMVTAECSIITDVTTGPDTTADTTSAQEAEGRIRMWVEIDGKQVPINSMSNPPQDPAAQPAGEEKDKVTFCNRVHRQELTDGENDDDGIDKMRTYLKTKDANAFNWLRLNLGSGLHTIQVYADLCVRTTVTTAGVQCDKTTPTLPTAGTGGAAAEGFVGNRSIIVVPSKLANDATILEGSA